MLEKGKRYLVIENMYNMNILDIFENGIQDHACLTQIDLLQLIRTLTNTLTDVPNKLEKGQQIEIIEVKYQDEYYQDEYFHSENKVWYIEFIVLVKSKLDDKESQTDKIPFSWNFIREEFLVEIPIKYYKPKPK